MAAAPGNKNAAGNTGGKSLQDRQLAAEVRTLTLTRIKEILLMPRVDMIKHDADLYDQILVKLAGSVLPRLTEITGEEGRPVTVLIAKEVAKKHDLKPGTGKDSK